ncbi:hypothetical protein GW916_04830 [bacterium]|nr:hypothetical protein [bacterium]
MRASLRFFSLVLLMGLQVSCLPVSDQNSDSAAACSVNGREPELYGKWKKLTGYGPDQSSDNLRDDFDVMIIPQGTHMCEAKFVNKAQTYTRYHATFGHHARNKELDYRITAVGKSDTGLQKNATYDVDYTLGCNGRIPTLRFEYSNGDIETYESWSTKVQVTDCGQNPDTSKSN